MARTYTQLQKEKSFEELKEFEIAVLERYATSDYVVSQKDVARDNNITPSCFKRIKEDAIIHAYISREMFEAIRNKAINKSEMRIQQSGGKCVLYYERLIKQREEFLVTAISKVKIKSIAEDVANNPSKPITYFKRKYDLESDHLVRLILKIAILEVIVNDEIVDLIEKRSIENSKQECSEMIHKFILKLKEKRKEVQCPYTTNLRCESNHQCRRCKIRSDYSLYMLTEEFKNKNEPLDYKGDNESNFR